MLQQAYGEDCLSRTQCHEWHQRLKSGRTSTEEDPKSGRPSTSMDDDHVEKVLAMIRQNRRLTVREVAEEVGICRSSCHLILTDKLKMRCVAAKFVPRLLTDAQKEKRVTVSQEMLDRPNADENYLKNVITGDETWLYGYDDETKVQSSQWMGKLSPRPKKVRQSRSNVKVMLTVFFYWKGIAHYDFVPRGETVNKEFYINVLKHLREAMRRKRPEAQTNNTWILYHDNTPAHASLLIREYLTKHETTVVSQPPYFPDLAPADIYLFPKLKSSLKCRRFQTVEETEENSIQDLRAIAQNTFQDAFQNWKKKKGWERSIKSGGEYFEGDKFD